MPSLRVAWQHGLTLDEYNEARPIELENLDESRLDAFNRMVAQKKVAHAYHKRVRKKSFMEGELVWRSSCL